MVTAVTFLTYLGIILLIGLITTIISQKFKVPNVLLLLITGIIIGTFQVHGQPLMSFPDLFLTSISVLALVMVIFDASSRFSLKRVEIFSLKTLWLSVVFLLFNLLFLTFFTAVIFDINSILYALVFAALMSGTDPAVVLTMLQNTNQRVFSFLKFESLINTPITVLIPFIILGFQSTVGSSFFISTFLEQAKPLILQISAGVGSGIVIGLFVFKFMKKYYSVTLSPLAIFTAAILAYAIAENIGGNGVIAVTSMGLLFGYVQVKEKVELLNFSLIFSTSLEILVFVIIGMVITIPFTVEFLIKSLILFTLFIGIRFLAVHFTLHHGTFNLRERIFITLNAQKGIAVAVVVFSLVNLGVPELDTVVNLSIIFMLYSIILSTVIIRFREHLLRSEEPLPNLKAKALKKKVAKKTT